MIERIEQFSNLRVLVVGDVMLDRYLWGDVERISPEAASLLERIRFENLFRAYLNGEIGLSCTEESIEWFDLNLISRFGK